MAWCKTLGCLLELGVSTWLRALLSSNLASFLFFSFSLSRTFSLFPKLVGMTSLPCFSVRTPQRRVNGQDHYIEIHEWFVYDYAHIGKDRRWESIPGLACDESPIRRMCYLIARVTRKIDEENYECDVNYITDGLFEPRMEWSQSGFHGRAIISLVHLGENQRAWCLKEATFNWLGDCHDLKHVVFKSLTEIFHTPCPANFLTGWHNQNPWCQVRHSLSRSSDQAWHRNVFFLRRSTEVLGDIRRAHFAEEREGLQK